MLGGEDKNFTDSRAVGSWQLLGKGIPDNKEARRLL